MLKTWLLLSKLALGARLLADRWNDFLEGDLSAGEIEPAGPSLRFFCFHLELSRVSQVTLHFAFPEGCKTALFALRLSLSLSRSFIHLFARISPNSAEFYASTTQAIEVTFQRSALHITPQLYLRLYLVTSISSQNIQCEPPPPPPPIHPSSMCQFLLCHPITALALQTHHRLTKCMVQVAMSFEPRSRLSWHPIGCIIAMWNYRCGQTGATIDCSPTCTRHLLAM